MTETNQTASNDNPTTDLPLPVQALKQAVARCIAEGSPVVTELRERRFLHMKGDDAVIGRALHSARNLLNLIEAKTPAGYAIRALIEAEGIDLAALRAEVTTALDLPVPAEVKPAEASAPEAPAPSEVLPPVTGVDPQTVEKLLLAAIKQRLDEIDVAAQVKEVVEGSLETYEFKDMARELIDAKVDDYCFDDFDDTAREFVEAKVDEYDFNDFDDIAREKIEEKVDSDVDPDSLAREVIEEKIDSDLELGEMASDLMRERVGDFLREKLRDAKIEVKLD